MIGTQEAANQASTAKEAASLQLKEATGAEAVANKVAAGEAASQNRELTKQGKIMDDAAREYATAQGTTASTQAAKDEAWGGAIESGIGAIGTFAGSDKRLKKNIKLIGKSPSGLKIYAFEYIDKFFGDGIYQGVMSNEIPNDAVINNGGYDRVDYSKLDVEFKKL